MSKEEIIKQTEYSLTIDKGNKHSVILTETLQGLLDLYNKEKEKNKELIKIINENIILVEDDNGNYKELNINIDNYISKDKIREKIKEINEKIEEIENNINNSIDEERTYWKKAKHDLIMQRFILQELLEE